MNSKKLSTNVKSVKTFSQIRISRMIEKEFTCENCGCMFNSHNLHLHHKNRNKRNNKETNLILLCSHCHREAHNQLNILDFKLKKCKYFQECGTLTGSPLALCHKHYEIISKKWTFVSKYYQPCSK